jgi:hypothetical protein
LDRRGIAADRGDSLIQLGLMAAGNKYPRAFMGETLRNAEADAELPPVTRATLLASLSVIVSSHRVRPRQ